MTSFFPAELNAASGLSPLLVPGRTDDGWSAVVPGGSRWHDRRMEADAADPCAPHPPTRETGQVRSLTVRAADGRSLHALTQGEGDHLVVLEAGLGAGGASWAGVLDLLGPEVRAVAYDRAGYGGSDRVRGPRDLAALSADLLAVVDAVPDDRLVLVGHSWGGPIVRHAAQQLADRGREVRGVLLVDPAEELADLYFTPLARGMNRAQGVALPVLARLGLLAPLQRAAVSGLPEALRAEAAASVSTLGAAFAVAEESRHMTRGLQSLRLDPPPPLPGAVSVISGRRPEGLGRRMRDELTAAHRARADREQGRFLPAEQSGHVVGASQPELIAGEIERLLR